MSTTANPASDLERRKRLRIRLRPDIVVEPHRYEGRTFYVVKDPVSLRYYRLKDNEQFLLQFLDGKHTLEQAQKAYEKEYRPERLRLEDLEGFAQQLLTAGLAISDSPKSGQLLFERRGKRRRREFLQYATNILYIKIPLFDPERLLTWMLRYVGWIFSFWFSVFSVVLMVSALLLVLTHFNTFLAKLPSYHEFFSFKTAMNLYVALAIVKVIHEFGHGLSCKYFGGEVHEMGALLMCLSPALYCNVSDAWILPNKWHRIIISFAGIYVELVIAAIATFIWWNTPTQPYINNLALSLMIVCSVSTVIFNANPLMRFDGYYVLSDWLEIPNLREKANRYLQNLFLDKCLGIEVPPEEYMQLGRKIGFIFFAVVSYFYRWLITFSILYMFYSFLRPYKLEMVGNLLTLAAVASMTIWPCYRMGQAIYRRGRLPDMKRARVMITSSVAVAVLLFLALVPVPISRIRGLALVQAHPDHSSQILLKRSAILYQLKVRVGDQVIQGEELAVFRDPELEAKIAQTTSELNTAETYLQYLQQQLRETGETRDKERLRAEIAGALRKRDVARETLSAFQKIRDLDLVVRAPRSGVIGQGPRVDDIGKMFEGTREGQQQPQPLFTIHTDKLRLCMPLVTYDYNRLLRDLHGDDSQRVKQLQKLDVYVRIHGRDSQVWTAQIERYDDSEARYIPLPLSSRGGGPVAVHPPSGNSPGLVPQTQHFLVYLTIDDPDNAIGVGAMAQVKIYLQPETCLSWAWRTINDVFNLRLM